MRIRSLRRLQRRKSGLPGSSDPVAPADLNGADSASDLLAVPDEVTQRRFGGLERLYGVAGAQRIRGAHVVVVGVGGVGSWAAEA